MKQRAIVFFIIIMFILAAPAVVMFAFPSAQGDSSENRELAPAPVLLTENGVNMDFFNECDSYVSDHIGFRSQLVSANTSAYITLFHMSPEDDVIMGSDGWLYYAKTLDDYFNVPSVSDRGINNIAHSLKMMQSYIEASDSSFVIAFAPNKNTLYSNHMPANYVQSGNVGNLDRIEAAMLTEGVNFVSLQDLFKSQNEEYYRKKDSHWNYEGALMAYNAMMEKTGVEYNAYDDMLFAESYEWTGDLSNMLYASDAPLDGQRVPMKSFGYKYTSKQTKVESNRLDTYNQEGRGRAIIYRDSFGNTLIPFFAENFAECYFSKITPYNMADVDEFKPDVTIIELVERNIPNLAKAAPVMMAEKTTVDGSGFEVSGDAYELCQETASEYTHFYGYVDESLLGDSYRVYTLISDGNGKADYYEAFPIYEKLLIDGEDEGRPKDNGFSVYIPMTDCHVASIVVETNGTKYIINTAN